MIRDWLFRRQMKKLGFVFVRIWWATSYTTCRHGYADTRKAAINQTSDADADVKRCWKAFHKQMPQVVAYGQDSIEPIKFLSDIPEIANIVENI